VPPGPAFLKQGLPGPHADGFVVAGAFVFSAALTYELVVKGMSNKAYRFAMGLAVATAFVLTWVNFVLAVDVSLANFSISVWSSLASLGPPSRGCGRAEWRSHWSGRRLLKCSSRSSRLFSGRPVLLQERRSPSLV
jgi:hypothetical protein